MCDDKKEIRCAVACINASGEPDLHFVKVKCTGAQLEEGLHYDAAKSNAEDEGYEKPMIAYDEMDYAGKHLCGPVSDILEDWSVTETVEI